MCRERGPACSHFLGVSAMPTRFPFFALATGLVLSPLAPAGEPGKRDLALKVGSELPFHVADFVAGPDKGHCGCPSVMISNQDGRGLVIWARTADEPIVRLAASAEGKGVDGKKTQGYLVVFDTPEEKVEAQFKDGDWTNITIGKSRHSSKDEFSKWGFGPTTAYAIFLVERKEIKSLWTLSAVELTKAKSDAVLNEAAAFLKSAAKKK